MRLKPLGSNQNELTLNNTTKILFSYETPVAAWTARHGFMQTTVYYSKTTARHITAWMQYHRAAPIAYVPQSCIDTLLD